MEPFIRSDQYNFIRAQAQILVNGHASANDTGVLQALKALTQEKVLQLFTDTNEEQRELLCQIVAVTNKEQAEIFVSQIKPYVIPFKAITEQTMRKLFPKAKKLKLPSLEHRDLKEMSYLGWDDLGSNRKYIITEYNNKLIGIHGTFTSIHQKGICSFCNRHEEVGLFMSTKKGSGKDTYINRGNYICQDSEVCNRNLTVLDKLHDFIERLQ
ncbi:FusB/FusC family EF-G-binding protein [Bacillus sp. 165]|uniref:FusB/FusC family EF-G-binding protein n=1 Tax=Bacillus sp. 165 TaxID=1529117 RepID=UPI001AD9E608|nr:FusB/FusC family EF-G-binding protein [Bacillus sp. 165]MBO9129483.1 FusB/FusC family EF-G-binding protein [Bacillus sp. 165]